MSTRTQLGARIELQKRVPCFHCSKSLQYFPQQKVYIGFALVTDDGIVRVLHRSCIKDFIRGVEPY